MGVGIVNKQQDLFNIEWKLIYSWVDLTHSDGHELLFYYCLQKNILLKFEKSDLMNNILFILLRKF